MCSKEETDEIVETFKQLPDLYQKWILGVVRDRKSLYDLQVAASRLNPNCGFDSVMGLLKVETVRC